MFDFSWSEIMLIGVVALVFIGPKDMPVALRAISRAIKRVRRMAGEFQHHMDDMLREADLQDVQSTFRDLRAMNVKSALTNFVDADGTLSRSMADPFAAHAVPPAAGVREARLAAGAVMRPQGAAPDFVPPEAGAAAAGAAAPDFIPPGVPPPVRPPIRAEDL